MMKPSGFVRDVITKYLNTILTSMEFQWICNFSINELAMNAKSQRECAD